MRCNNKTMLIGGNSMHKDTKRFIIAVSVIVGILSLISVGQVLTSEPTSFFTITYTSGMDTNNCFVATISNGTLYEPVCVTQSNTFLPCSNATALSVENSTSSGEKFMTVYLQITCTTTITIDGNRR